MDGDNSKLRVGETFLGKYQVLAQIGAGNGGHVFKANHALMDKLVAIKTVVCADRKDLPEHLARLQLEARAASALSHPNVVSVHDYGQLPDGNAYAVMDFVEGQDLDAVIEREGRIPWRRSLDIFLQVCAGLQHAHERGVVHRDIKPRNIMLTRAADGDVIAKVVDFGIAKLMPNSGKEGLKMTVVGELFGTPYYMSPELCQNKSADHRTDIYSLGCTMYAALVGMSPAKDSSMLAVLKKHVSEPAKPFSRVWFGSDVPDEFEAVVMKALAKNPDDRWQTMKDMREALQAVYEYEYRINVPTGAMPALSAAMFNNMPGGQGLNFGTDADRESELTELAQKDKVEFLMRLASKYDSEKRYAEAEALYSAVIALIEKTTGVTDERLIGPLTKLAKLYYLRDQINEAEQLHARCVEVIQSAHSPTPKRV